MYKLTENWKLFFHQIYEKNKNETGINADLNWTFWKIKLWEEKTYNNLFSS